MSDHTENKTLMQQAGILLEKSFMALYDLRDEQLSNQYLDEAAVLYDQVGSPRDAEAVRLFKIGKDNTKL